MKLDIVKTLKVDGKDVGDTVRIFGDVEYAYLSDGSLVILETGYGDVPELLAHIEIKDGKLEVTLGG